MYYALFFLGKSNIRNHEKTQTQNLFEKINSDVAYCWLYSLGTGSLSPLKTPDKAGVPGLFKLKNKNFQIFKVFRFIKQSTHRSR